MDSRATSRPRLRWGTLVLVVLLHLAVLAGLVQVFAPDFTARVAERAASLATVTITAPLAPPPEPEPEPEPDSGSAGAEAPRAIAREVVAPPAPLPRSSRGPRASSTGLEDVTGAGEQGVGSGAGDAGSGLGAGGTGNGGGARPLELVSGRIDDARDYPIPPGGRRVRRGHDVVIELTVGTDGRVSACRVTDASPDPEADAITCRLATERFVFRPRLDSAGEPVVGTYRWRQRWF